MGALLATGCASGGRLGRVPPPETVVVFPSPPDTARIQFLFSLSDENDVRGRLSRGPSSNRLMRPYGVAYHAGRIFLCDTQARGVAVIDLAKQSMDWLRPEGIGQIAVPINCTVDPVDGRLYVTDSRRRQVVVFDSDLHYVSAFGPPEGQPVDVFVQGDELWVTDMAGRRLRVYDKGSFELLRSIPEGEPSRDEDLYQPADLWISEGRVYVTDLGASRVQVYDVDGTWVKSIGKLGRAPGQFVRPKGITDDDQGRIYVVDAAFENIQVFEPDGTLLLYFGGGEPAAGSMQLPAQVRIVEGDLAFFEGYVDPRFELQSVILVTNQYGDAGLNVYGAVRPAGAARSGS